MDTSVPDHLQPSVTAVSFPQCHSPSISMPCAAHALGHGAEGTPVAPRCLWGDALPSQGAGGVLTLTQMGWGQGRAEPLSARVLAVLAGTCTCLITRTARYHSHCTCKAGNSVQQPAAPEL